MLQKGSIVRVIAGHDKHRFYVVLDADLNEVLLADGKVRPLEKPKRKNQKHVQVTQSALNLSEITSNKRLRKELAPYNEALWAGTKRKAGI